ncbi:HAD family hydrolase [Clostridium sp. CCUG 7971]|uniref:HAD family hydrolase n=1 Tax=Clostridium sp. CCUG 7971 TaxID=2811414 RepID=UPI001ABB0D1A|nr:HAD family hydrolase [Clostridium sp. CCUG 7971]MBO3442983.1 HAD family hydrolase [Clostridium sp. CCUG 7971]
MLKAVIFDMDGVLVNTEPVYYKVTKEILNENGHDIDYKEYEKYIGMTNECTWELLKQKYSINIDTNELIENMMILKDVIIKRDGYELIENVESLLENLKQNNIKIGLASSSPICDILDVTKSTGIYKYFDKLITGESVEKSKPSPDIFLKAANELGVNSEECIVIEDSKNGVLAAKSANMKCIGFFNKDSGKQDLSLSDIIISNMRDIDYDYIKKIFNIYKK